MITKTSILLVLVLALTACSAATQNGASNGGANTGKLNPMSELIVGTLKLDGTTEAVTKPQATALLPLWQVYKQLISSDTAAQAEIDGLAQQIRDTMTAEQRTAITDMKLSQSDVMAYMQQQGVGVQPSGSSQSNRTTTQNNSGGFPGGGPGGGMLPGGMGGEPGGFAPGGMTGGSSGTRQATDTQTANSGQAAGARAGNMNGVPAPLIEALIQYLQKTAGLTATPQP